jgi:hypothetical protein
MRFVLVLASVFTATVLAQQPQLRPTPPDLQPAQPAPEPQESLGLIPEAPEPAPKPRGTALVEPRAALDRSTGPIDRTSAVQNEMAERVRLRELIVKVRKEPKVAAELDRAETAKTDLQKREALKNYYTLLYDRVAKLDPKLKTRVTELQRRSINRLTQTRLDPTEPLERE